MSTIDLHALRRDRGVDLSVWPPRYDNSYLPADDEDSWLPELEKADPNEREAVILEKLRCQVSYVWEHSPFYRRLWEEAGVDPGVLRTLKDLARFPVVTKDDLRASQTTAPPFGEHLCVEPREVARIHGTSGTTGKPTVFGYSADDWVRVGEAHARIMWGSGIRPTDTIMVCSFFSLYLGSWGALVGGQRLGARMFPFGAGVQGQTVKAVEWALEIQPTALYGTPSYALRLAEVAREEGVDPRGFGFRVLFFSGEPGAGIPSTKRRIEETFGGICIDMGTMAEMTPWMTNAECTQRNGMHMYQDLVYSQICDPETYLPVPMGGEGMPVYTHLERTSQPMIRLASGDRARWVDDACACGRTYPTLKEGLHGRYDDMIVVKGVNVYPSAIEDVLRAVPGFGGEFRVIVSRGDSLDRLVVQAEHDEKHALADRQDALRRRMGEALHRRLGVSVTVELAAPESLERTEFKSRRVVDDRDLFGKMTHSTR